MKLVKVKLLSKLLSFASFPNLVLGNINKKELDFQTNNAGSKRLCFAFWRNCQAGGPDHVQLNSR